MSNPLGLSINNAFGRLWPANAPFGLEGIGTSTIVDPTGIPLANGGVLEKVQMMAAHESPRNHQALQPDELRDEPG